MPGDADELAEQVDGEFLRGSGGEAFEEELQQPWEVVPLELPLDVLQPLSAVRPLQRQLAQQLVEQPQRQQVLELVVGLEQGGRDPEDGGHQVGGVHRWDGFASRAPAPAQRRQALSAQQVGGVIAESVCDVQRVASTSVRFPVADDAGAK